MARAPSAAVRGLIVNADDFGLSPGVNLGISKAHREGIVTSTSLLVNAPFSEHAAALSAEMPRLSIGLHADLSLAVAESDPRRAEAICREELERQIARFDSLTGRRPTHLDSHHNAHRHRDLSGPFVQFGELQELRVREHCDVEYVSTFYGHWGGRSHPEQASFAGLEDTLRTNGSRLIELACHPGFCDAELRSSYRHEREIELRTLCDERLPRLLDELGFSLLDSELQRQTRQRE